jgi:hypothetical protein
MGLPKRLFVRLLTPPPLLWHFKDGFPHVEWRGGTKTWRSLPKVALKQISWWVVRPLFIQWQRLVYQQSRPIDAPPAPPPLPRRLALAACWLNGFYPYEVRLWQSLGITTWDSLSQKIPESHCGAAHAARRAHWPDQCNPAGAVLSNKAALLELADPAWRSPFLTLDRNVPPEPPDWWHQALTGPGLVLKPVQGHAGRGVVRFRLDGEQLLTEALGQPIKEPREAGAAMSALSPPWLLEHWQQSIGSQEKALAMPFLQQGPSFPTSHSAAVVRVITEQAMPDAPIHVQIAWLRVPLPTSQEGLYAPQALIDLQGQVLPRPLLNLNTEQQQQQDHWQSLLAQGPIAALERCLELSIAMHQRLPPIDQVAWEWIPSEPEVQLIEGNFCFGLMVPQMFKVMQAGVIP